MGKSFQCESLWAPSASLNVQAPGAPNHTSSPLAALQEEFQLPHKLHDVRGYLQALHLAVQLPTFLWDRDPVRLPLSSIPMVTREGPEERLL